MFVDLVAVLAMESTVTEAFDVQQEIKKCLVSYRKEITEVCIMVVPENKVEILK
jgi:hypothetical protein